jgi:hypothetical protein
VDIHDPNTDAKLGRGPITSASEWSYTSRLDRAGSFTFTMPASDPKAATIERKRVVRAYADLGEEGAAQRVVVGSGIVDQIVRFPQPDGSVLLTVSGDDLLRELTYRSVLNLKLYLGGNPVSHATALDAVAAYAPAGWTFTPDGSPPNDSVYGYFNGESVLAATIKIAEKSQSHFVGGVTRDVTFGSTFTSSGIRARQAGGNLPENACAIVALTEQINTYDLLTRIYPRGSGNSEVQLTLRATDRTAPDGYTLNTLENYIENDVAVATYGRIEEQVAFREIGPIENSDADVLAASNMLFDAALETLRRQSSEPEQATYTLSVAGCRALLEPLQSIRVTYRDRAAGLLIDEELNILEATWRVDTSGLYTTDLVVSAQDRWPQSDVSLLVDNIAQGQVYQALPQLNANHYVTAYTKLVDEDNVASFRFRFGDEVTQLQQVLFEFQILPFESTIRSIAGTVSSTEAGGSATPTTAGGGSVSTAAGAGGGTTVSAAAGGGTTVSAASGGSTTPTTSSGGSATPTSSGGGASTPTAFASVTTQDSDTPTWAGGITAHDSGQNEPNGAFSSALTGGVNGAPGAYSDAHQHGYELFDHTHETYAFDHVHGVAIGNHTHTISIAAHTHTVSISAHTHTVSVAAHTHGVTLANHTHGVTIADHTHGVTIAAHTHTVSIASHTHAVTGDIITVYGIFRESPENTYELADLDYQVNSGGWLDAAGDAVDVGSGWWRLDITDLVQNATNLRPLFANNILEIRSLTIDKTATIDAHLSIRSIIQATAVTP